MRNAVMIFVAVIIVGILASIGYAYTQNQHVQNPTPTMRISPTSTAQRVIFPTGGEKFTEGQKITLQWTPMNPRTTQIFLVDTDLASQGTSVSIVDRKYNIPDTGTYSYTIPQTVQNGTYTFEIGKLASNPFQIGTTGSTTQSLFCKPSDLQANLVLSPGAGNMYGTFTLKNISGKTCQIIGSNFIQPQYTVQNITVSHQGQAGTPLFSITPNQTIYSQVHYPNGPQCNGPVKQTTISFIYRISPTDSVTFKDTQEKTQQSIAACSSASDNTEVQIWGMSDKPITPQ